jgi:hypothetical protein
MLSIILYGRNDYHGYNYHKRAAMSINCVAELLTADSDEIIYVDYNTPNDLPTFPQAIEDILTAQAKHKIRILRVRPEQHMAFAKGALHILEPIARNIAIRRSNPANRWILSINSDMILVPHDPQQSLNDIVANLDDQCYMLPRFELPEYWWECSLSRIDPVTTIQQLRDCTKNFHLQMTVSHNDYLLYDNPGDFQLVPRKTLFEIHGFNEAMCLGWHNDSNLCKRLFLYFNHKIESLANQLHGYHCNHNRRATYLHAKTRAENSWRKFVSNVNTPYIPEQAESWGCANSEIEEIRLHEKLSDKPYLQALQQTLAINEPTYYQVKMNRERYNHLYYHSSHIFPYLADHLATIANNTPVAYIGHNQPLLALLVQFWQKMPYRGDLFCLNTLATENNNNPSVKYVDFATLKNSAAIFILDFGFDENYATHTTTTEEQRWLKLNSVTKIFVRLAKYAKKQHRKHASAVHKFIGINAVYSDFKCLFDRHIVTMEASYNSNLLYGYVKLRSNFLSLPLGRYLKSTVHYYSCYWFPILSLRFIQKIKRSNASKRLFLADTQADSKNNRL